MSLFLLLEDFNVLMLTACQICRSSYKEWEMNLKDFVNDFHFLEVYCIFNQIPLHLFEDGVDYLDAEDSVVLQLDGDW